MKRIAFTFWLIVAELQKLFGGVSTYVEEKLHHQSPDPIEELYHKLFDENDKPALMAFEYGYEGYQKLKSEGKLHKDSIITIIDYSKPSNERRLWVVDIKNERLIHHSLVAHGKNSGLLVPGKFSNVPDSHMSSPGFYITGETYYGKHGYSLRIDGVETGINDKARERDIVIHSAAYVSMAFIQKNGRLGRSFGCLALPPTKNKAIIDSIKNKSCLFVYGVDKQYIARSKMMRYLKRI